MYVPAHFVVSSTRHEAQLLTAASPDLHGSTKSCVIHKNVISIAVLHILFDTLLTYHFFKALYSIINFHKRNLMCNCLRCYKIPSH